MGQKIIPLVDRVLPRVDMSGGPDACWPWTGSRDRDGYGTVALGSRTNHTRTSTKAHRLMYQLVIGEIPLGFHVCHRCDNPPCCNPRHLFAATPADNMADMVAKGRSLTGDLNPARREPGRFKGRNFVPAERRARGESHGSAKLTEKMVRSIRERSRNGESQSEIARSLGIDHSTVGRIVRGQIWAHVA